MIVDNLIRVVNVGLAGWLLVWAAYVYRERRAASDYLGGKWLALSWGTLLLATIIGSLFAISRHLAFSPSAPLVTLALAFGLLAQLDAWRKK